MWGDLCEFISFYIFCNSNKINSNKKYDVMNFSFLFAYMSIFFPNDGTCRIHLKEGIKVLFDHYRTF